MSAFVVLFCLGLFCLRLFCLGIFSNSGLFCPDTGQTNDGLKTFQVKQKT